MKVAGWRAAPYSLRTEHNYYVRQCL